jgi:DUF4097 and DUF4098 domain-containing protein YvlB
MTTPRIQTFATPEPIEVSVEIPSGDVVVRATATGESRVTITGRRDDGATRSAIEQTRVSFTDGRLVVAYPGRFRMGRTGTLHVEATVPDGSSVRVRTASADTTVEGRIDSLDVSSASGDVRADEVDGNVRFNTASGDLRLDTVVGEVSARGASGDVRIGRAGTVQVNTASGDVLVDELGSSGKVHTVSGDQRIGRVGEGDLDLRAVSGDVSVGVAKGAVAHLTINTVTGTIRTNVPPADEVPDQDAPLRINVRTVSGDVSVQSARVARSA